MIIFNAKASADEAQEARGLRQPHGAEGLHAQAGAPAVRVVSARAQEQLSRAATHPRDGSHAPADHRPPARRQEQVDRQPRALPAPLPGADRARRCGRAVDEPRHPRHRAGRGHPHPASGHQRAVVRPRPGRRARDRASGQPGVRRAATSIERPAGRRRRRRRQRPGGRFRRGRGRLRLPPHQGRVHADLLRRPRAAAPGQHAARRDAGDGRASAPATRTTARRATYRRGPLDARRARPAHRARRAARAPSCASSRRALAELLEELDAAHELAKKQSSKRRSHAPATARSTRIPFIDPFDLRFRNRVQRADAVQPGR